MNIDRTGYNLPRIGPGEFALIDHAQILGGYDWTIDKIEKQIEQPSIYNHVAASIGDSGNHILKQKMIRYALIYRDGFSIDDESVNFEQLDRICRFDIGTTEYISELLSHRTKLLPELVHSAWTKGQLFQ